MRAAIVLALAAFATSGCDRFGSGQGGSEAGNATAEAEPPAGNVAGSIADAGIISSRSLAGLANGESGSIKNPGAVQASSTGSVAPDALLGRWSEGNCKEDIEIFADGTFRSYTGGGGTWRLDGDTLTLTGAAGSFRLRLQSVEADRIVTINQDGAMATSTRC